MKKDYITKSQKQLLIDLKLKLKFYLKEIMIERYEIIDVDSVVFLDDVFKLARKKMDELKSELPPEIQDH